MLPHSSLSRRERSKGKQPSFMQGAERTLLPENTISFFPHPASDWSKLTVNAAGHDCIQPGWLFIQVLYLIFMKAAAVYKPAPIEGNPLKLIELDVPAPGQGEILVHVM